MHPFRALTLNLWGPSPPLEARLALVAAGVKALAPDVVALQEVQEIPGELPNQAVTLARATGYEIVFAPAVGFRGGHEGLAFLSRHPILTTEAHELPHATEVERRILLSAKLNVAGRALWVHTTHLNWRLQHGLLREAQVVAIDELVSRHATESDPQILMGDFNARPESDEMRWLSGLTTLGGRRVLYQDAWARRHPDEPGWTWASANPYTAPLRFLQPDRRLDYIYVTPERRDGRARIHDCRLVFERPDDHGVFVSDHYGLFAEIQIVPDPPAVPAPPSG